MAPVRISRFRIDFQVPLAVGEVNELGDLECVEPCAKRDEINKFNVNGFYLPLDECEISVRSFNSHGKKR